MTVCDMCEKEDIKFTKQLLELFPDLRHNENQYYKMKRG